MKLSCCSASARCSFLRLAFAVSLLAVGCAKDESIVVSEDVAATDGALASEIALGTDGGPEDVDDAGPDQSGDQTADQIGDQIGDQADDLAGSPSDAATDGAAETADQETTGAKCSTSADCAAATPYCDLASEKCAECVVGSHCAGAGARCVAGSCAPAVACNNDKACVVFDAVCDKAKGFCVPCLATSDCLAPQTCQANTCLKAAKPCASSKDCAAQGQVCSAKTKQCVDCADDGDCGDAQYCLQNFCVPDSCAAGTAACAGAASVKTCSVNGSQWSETPCPANEICEEGACIKVICTAGELRCTGLQAEKCAPNGTVWEKAEDCAAAGLACSNGSCVPPLCKAGAKQCVEGGIATCKADLLGWSAPTACPADSSCANGNCQPWTCTPNSLTCMDQVAVSCSADGLTASSVDCAKDGKICSGGKCLTQVCQPNQVDCDGIGTKTCDSKGLAWGPLTACPNNSSCSAGKCEPWVCTPKSVVCSGDDVITCQADGLQQGIEPCAKQGKVCEGGQCKATVCAMGASKCQANSVVSCENKGLQWSSPAPCPGGSSCSNGKCLQWACGPDTKFCEGGAVKLCAANGLSASVAESCATAGKVCSNGFCVTPLCVPGSKACNGNDIVNCDGDGLGWGPPSTCAGSTTCAKGSCAPWVCAPNTLSCQGKVAKSCSADGLAEQSTDCGATGQLCSKGKCVNAVCTPGAGLCQGNSSQTCSADGLSWSPLAACASSTTCVAGVCKPHTCTPNSTGCSGNSATLCAADGLSTAATDCTKSGKVCVGGTCLAALCTAGATTCSGNGVVTCNGSGTGWSSPVACNGNNSCDQGKCVPWVCTPNAVSCEGTSIATCAANGLSKQLSDCTASGKVCVAGSCMAKICGAGAVQCSGAGTVTCNSTGTAWSNVTACASSTTCDAGQCKPWICTPNAVSCEGTSIATCAANGLTKALSDCATSGKICVGGSCQTKICSPGAVICSGAGTATCNSTGTDWSTITPCSSSQTCENGQCKPWVCAPKAVVCEGTNVSTCAANGLSKQLSDCKVSGKICVAGACQTQVCQPLSTKCVNDSVLSVCAADGMSWGNLSMCPSSTTCSQGNCVPWSCKPNEVACEGNSVTTCAADGLSKQSIDCAKDGKVCDMGKCASVVCKPGTAKCEGNASSQCQSPGTSWAVISCDDGDACTQDICNLGSGYCAHQALKCNDGKVCTADSCDIAKGCLYALLTGPCDDGTACTAGEVCDSKGECKAPGVADLSLLAGDPNNKTTLDGKGKLAGFTTARAVTRWLGSSWLVADGKYLRVVAEDGAATTLAGSTLTSIVDGKGANAGIVSGDMVAGDGQGNAFFADSTTVLRKVSADGTVITLGGLLGTGYTDGPVAKARFGAINGLALDGAGNLWIADSKNNRLRRMTPAGVVETVAGTGEASYFDGPAAQAKIASPVGIAAANDGAIYFGTATRLRALVKGNVITVAGSGTSGVQDGAASSAQFAYIYGISAHPGGLVWLTDYSGQRVRSVDVVAGQVATAVGSSGGYTDGKGSSAKLYYPTGLAIDRRGRGAVVDQQGRLMRSIQLDSVLCNDGDPCTADSCDPGTGTCKTAAIGTGLSCSDGNACTTGEACDSGGACKGGKVKACDDGNPCTDDLCDAWTGACAAVNNAAPCVGTDKCTLHTCASGKCGPAQAEFATLAGTTAAGVADGKGALASFFNASGIGLAPDGALWIAERSHNKIRRIAPDGTVTTVAGFAGTGGSVDGPVAVATFYGPASVVVDKGGLIYVADTQNHRIRRITPGGMVGTLAGSSAGYADGSGSSAKFYSPEGMAIDAKGNLYVSDVGNQRIRKVTPGGQVSTVAGSGTTGYLDGAASSAKFYSALALAVDGNGNLLIADTYNNRIRHIDLAKGEVSTVAGSGGAGSQDGAVSSATFHTPGSIAVTSGGIAVFDISTKRLRLIAGGKVTTIAGLGTSMDDGPIGTASLGNVNGMAVDSKGQLTLAQLTRIRYITETAVYCDDGSPCTTEACDPANGNCKVANAGLGSPCSDDSSCTSGDACDAKGICVGTAKKCEDGNACTEDLCLAGSGACDNPAWVATCTDGDACTPADLCLAGQCRSDLATLSTTAGQAGQGFVNGTGAKAMFGNVYAATWLPDGNAAVLDADYSAIRLVKPDGTVTTLCGGNGAGYVDGGCGQAKFYSPMGMTGDTKGNLYIADTGNHRIRVISAAGQVTTLAGSGTAGFQDGPGSSAAFKSPGGIAMGPDGTLMVADMGNYRLRKVAVDGSVSTAAGSGSSGKQDGAASSATFSSSLYGLAYDSQGRLWIADGGNVAVRRLDGGKTVTTVAVGGGGAVDGPVGSAKFGAVFQLAVAPSGTVYIADSTAYRIRWLSPAGQVGTLIGTSSGFADGAPIDAKFVIPRGIALGPKGKLLIGDGYRVRLVTPAAVDCDDSQACTLDACDKATSDCSNLPIGEGGTCSDGDACTVSEFCSKGSCGGGQAKSCDDSNPCTADSCDSTKGCVHVATAQGQVCGTDKVCVSGSCAPAACLTPVAQNGKYVGAPVTMETYSHGGGFSPTYQEYWYPQWSGTTIHRFDKNRNPLGSFSSGVAEIMQLAGDSDDTYYTANWGYQTINKWSGASSKLLWTYKVGSSASCVAVDNEYVYAMGSSGAYVHVLSKDQGKLVKTIALLSAPSTTPYGSLAVVGGSVFVGYDSGTVRRFDKGTGQMLDSFQAHVNIFNTSFNGKDYCVSANSNQVYCYTIAVPAPGCP